MATLRLIALCCLFAATACGAAPPCQCSAPDAIVLPDANATTLYGARACKIEPGAEKSILKTARWHYLAQPTPLPASCALLVP